MFCVDSIVADCGTIGVFFAQAAVFEAYFAVLPLDRAIFVVILYKYNRAFFVLVGTYVLSTMATIIDSFIGAPSGHYSDAEIADTKVKAETLAADVEAEGTVLVRNNDNTLPLAADNKKINVFGWASTAWLGGGSGSGGVSGVNTDLLAALTAYGVAYNTELTDMYKDFQDGREYTRTLSAWPEQSGHLYEPDINNQTYYTQSMLDNAKSFSDTAVVVIGRLAGESNDATKQQYKRTEKGGDIVVDDTRTMLELTTEEEDLLNYVGANYAHVVVLINSTNVMELGQIETIPGIDACLIAGLSGSEGATAVPEVLWGDREPSGRTADTWAYDLTTAASYANAGIEGVGKYSAADGLYPADGTTNGNLDTPYTYEQVSYVDYAEGIYIGYKWYETADAEGYWDAESNEHGTGYDAVVQYPFGYGLSYTSFDWKVTDAAANGSALTKDGNVTVKVTVTNTGDRVGKDVVQLYYTAPYTAGEIEKSSVELGAFAKTKELAPGESEEVTLTVPVSDMASYDAYDANHNGFTGYELDAGDYIFTVRHDAHDVDDDANATITCSLPAGVQYAEDTATGNAVSNKFTGSDAIDGVSLDGSDSDQNITYLTRADFADTFPKTNTPTRAMTDNVKALNLYTADDANGWINDADEAITTGAKNGLKIEDNGETTDLGFRLGSDFNDPQWDALLDQLTVDEMENLYINAYGGLAELKSVGKSKSKDADGPAQIGGFTGMGAGTGFPSSSTLAQTWNADLAQEEGRTIGTQALQNGYTGWYAPATNMHCSPFNGRNYEYYSEDSLLSGVICGSTVTGANQAGVYTYVKHFICDDGESGIYRDSVYTWMTEQTLRETYLRPFQMLVEDYDAVGLMSSYNRIGAVWAGGSEALLTGILRGEWGFDGAVVTDWGGSNDHALGVKNGSTLEMPAPGGDAVRELLKAVETGKISESDVDARLDELLTLVLDTHAAVETHSRSFDADAHHALARRAAAESAVLLKNDGDLLPLAAGASVAVIGDFAETPRYQGAGSSAVNSIKVDAFLDCLKDSGLHSVGFAAGFDRQGKPDDAKKAEAVALAKKADTVLLCLGLDEIKESEGLDRVDMKLADNQIELLQAVQQANPNTVVIVSAGASLETPWLVHCRALVYGAFGGQAGAGAMVDVLTGKINPSGKLAETWANAHADTPAKDNFAGAGRTVQYREGLYVGYRYYQTAGVPVAFPFGYGLSYTSFAYKRAESRRPQRDPDRDKHGQPRRCRDRTGLRGQARRPDLPPRAGVEGLYKGLAGGR